MDRNNEKSISVKWIVCVCAAICAVVAIIFAVLVMVNNPNLNREAKESSATEYNKNENVENNQNNKATDEPVTTTEAIIQNTENRITDEEAILSIKNYCYAKNADLKDIEEAGEYPVNWTVVSSDENEIVVLFRSYTAAQIRYYINPVSGDTYVTEYVDGITEQEERTDESFNVRDYL